MPSQAVTLEAVDLKSIREADYISEIPGYTAQVLTFD